MEIASLQIENFQSHKSTTIRPAPAGHLTVITGPSDSGKTAIIRALRWLYFNTPQGTDFIRVGARETSIILTLADGTRIIRSRSRGNKNVYEIIPPNGEKQTFAGFGVNVPLEVQQATGVRPVQIGDLELNLNLAEQLDGPFLGKSISAGARAKVLGKLAGTEEVDYAGKQLAADLHRRGQDEKRLAGEIAKLDEQIRGFNYLPAMKARIEKIEVLVSQAKAAVELRDKLAAYQERLYQCEDAISQARMIIFRWRGLEEAELFLAGIERKAARNEKLRWLAGRLEAAEKGIAACQGIMQKWSGLEEGMTATFRVAELSELYTRLNGLKQKLLAVAQEAAKATSILTRWINIEMAAFCIKAAETGTTRRQQIISLAAKLDRINKDIETARQQAVLHENRVAELEGAYYDALLAAGRCPTCGQEITSRQISILKEAV